MPTPYPAHGAGDGWDVTLKAYIDSADTETAAAAADAAAAQIANDIDNPATPVGAAASAAFVSPGGKTTTGPAAPLRYFNVKDFGAVGDGATDDAAAINAAITAANAEAVNGPVDVFLPYTANGYAAASTITLRSGVTLRGARRVAIKATAAVTQLIDTVTDAIEVGLVNLTLDGNGNASSFVVRVGNGAVRPTIDNCHITSTGTRRQGIETRDNVSELLISRCRFTGSTRAIRVNRNPVGVRIEKCEFSDWTEAAIQVLSAAGFAPSKVWITGNTINPHTFAGTAPARQPIQVQGVDTDPIRGLYIVNNDVLCSDTAHSDPTNPGSADAISVHRTHGFVISGNRVRNSGEVGITVAMQSKNGEVVGNTVVRSDSCGITTGSSTSTYTSNVIVANNVCVDNGMSRLGDQPARVRAGILPSTGSTDVTVEGNRCGNDETTNQLYGLSLKGTTRLRVGINHLDGNTTGRIYNDGDTTGTVIDDPLRVRNTADQTVNASTTLVDITGLSSAVDGNARYEVEVYLPYNSSTTADLALKAVAPAGATFQWTSNGPATTTTSPNSVITRQDLAVGSTAALGGTGGNAVALPLGELNTGATAGVFKFQYAQNTLDPTDTKILAGARMLLKRVA